MTAVDDSPVTFYAIFWPERRLLKVGITTTKRMRVDELLRHRTDLEPGIVLFEDVWVPRWWERAALLKLHNTFAAAFRTWREAEPHMPLGRGHTEAFIVPPAWTEDDVTQLIEEGIAEYGEFRAERAAALHAAAVRRHRRLARNTADLARSDRTHPPGARGTGPDGDGSTGAPAARAHDDGCRGVPGRHDRVATTARTPRLHPPVHGARRGTLRPGSPTKQSGNIRQGREGGSGRAGERERAAAPPGWPPEPSAQATPAILPGAHALRNRRRLLGLRSQARYPPGVPRGAARRAAPCTRPHCRAIPWDRDARRSRMTQTKEPAQ